MCTNPRREVDYCPVRGTISVLLQYIAMKQRAIVSILLEEPVNTAALLCDLSLNKYLPLVHCLIKVGENILEPILFSVLRVTTQLIHYERQVIAGIQTLHAYVLSHLHNPCPFQYCSI